jgi:nucleoside-diphosphate-sugar epimerase
VWYILTDQRKTFDILERPHMVLITGGAGYVGSVLAAELIRVGEAVRVVDTQWFGNPFAPDAGVEVIRGNINQLDASWLCGVDAVCHLSGLSNDPTSDFMPELALESNVRATRLLGTALAEKAQSEGREIRCLFASSCSVYYSCKASADLNVERMTEDMPVAPGSTYSKSKRLAEIELLRIASDHPLFCPVILRKGTIFGLSPRMRFDLVVNAFTLNAWRNRVLTVNGSGETWRPLIHIKDVVDAYVYLLSAPTGSIRCEIFNVLHKNYRILELAHWVAEVLEEHRNVAVQVKRDRSSGDGSRSYCVDEAKLARSLGFRSERGTSCAILDLWDALQEGRFGAEPESNPRYFNIQFLRQEMKLRAAAGAA